MMAPTGMKYRAEAGEPGNPGGLALDVLHRDPGPQFRILALDDEAGGFARDRVHPFLHRDVFHDIAELDGPAHFREHGVGKGVPFRQHLSRRHLLTILHIEVGAVGQGISFPLHPLVGHE